jgi:hypothetical protein
LPLLKGRRSRLLVVALFLTASVAFALLAFYSPVKSASDWCAQNASCSYYCGLQKSQYLFCANAEATGNPMSFFTSIRNYQSYVEIAEGFAVVAALSLLFQLKDRLSRALPSVARLSAHQVVLSHRIRITTLLFSVAGAIAFLAMAAIDVGYNIPSLAATSKWILFHYIDLHGIYLSEVAFPVAVVTTLGFTIYRLERGLSYALKWALRTFTLPAITALEVGILVFDSREINLYATKFVPWSLDGICLVSNWFVLIVALSLTLLAYALLLSKRTCVRR